ncbi:hypothetical protein [Pseudomonas sp. MWU13-2105]|uniref:hypothetical protein n=1 Tax=Pseudomonas sp. MWU13-2105 TaxID=2935074 RepID=UPI00200E1CF4|nr:hypothetical protein [Pseudomonas sp. MWU13-2105]
MMGLFFMIFQSQQSAKHKLGITSFYDKAILTPGQVPIRPYWRRLASDVDTAVFQTHRVIVHRRQAGATGFVALSSPRPYQPFATEFTVAAGAASP